MRRQELADDLTVISDEHIEERLAVKICCGGSKVGTLLDPQNGLVDPSLGPNHPFVDMFLKCGTVNCSPRFSFCVYTSRFPTEVNQASKLGSNMQELLPMQV